MVMQKKCDLHRREDKFMSLKSANEMRSFASKYNKEGLLKFDKCPFDVVANTLKADEEALFCLGSYYGQAIAFTNQRIIVAKAKSLMHSQLAGIEFITYENVNSVKSNGTSSLVNSIAVYVKGEKDYFFNSFYPEKLPEAVALINDIVEKYKNGSSGSAGTIIQQTSQADELKKFKELLDSGVISQEEFDAKKKQLLGL